MEFRHNYNLEAAGGTNVANISNLPNLSNQEDLVDLLCHPRVGMTSVNEEYPTSGIQKENLSKPVQTESNLGKLGKTEYFSNVVLNDIEKINSISDMSKRTYKSPLIKTRELIVEFEKNKNCTQKKWLNVLNEDDAVSQFGKELNLDVNTDMAKWASETLRKWAKINDKEELTWNDSEYLASIVKRVYILNIIKHNSSHIFKSVNFTDLCGVPNTFKSGVVKYFKKNESEFLRMIESRNNLLKKCLGNRYDSFVERVTDGKINFHDCVTVLVPELNVKFVNEKEILRNANKWSVDSMKDIINNVYNNNEKFNSLGFLDNIGDIRASNLYNNFFKRLKGERQKELLNYIDDHKAIYLNTHIEKIEQNIKKLNIEKICALDLFVNDLKNKIKELNGTNDFRYLLMAVTPELEKFYYNKYDNADKIWSIDYMQRLVYLAYSNNPENFGPSSFWNSNNKEIVNLIRRFNKMIESRKSELLKFVQDNKDNYLISHKEELEKIANDNKINNDEALDFFIRNLQDRINNLQTGAKNFRYLLLAITPEIEGSFRKSLFENAELKWSIKNIKKIIETTYIQNPDNFYAYVFDNLANIDGRNLYNNFHFYLGRSKKRKENLKKHVDNNKEIFVNTYHDQIKIISKEKDISFDLAIDEFIKDVKFKIDEMKSRRDFKNLLRVITPGLDLVYGRFERISQDCGYITQHAWECALRIVGTTLGERLEIEPKIDNKFPDVVRYELGKNISIIIDLKLQTHSVLPESKQKYIDLLIRHGKKKRGKHLVFLCLNGISQNSEIDKENNIKVSYYKLDSFIASWFSDFNSFSAVSVNPISHILKEVPRENFSAVGIKNLTVDQKIRLIPIISFIKKLKDLVSANRYYLCNEKKTLDELDGFYSNLAFELRRLAKEPNVSVDKIACSEVWKSLDCLMESKKQLLPRS